VDLYLVRHGLSTANVDGRVQGHWDTDLTPEGLRQAGATGRFLAHYFAGLGVTPAALYSSDLKRAWHTAQAIGRYLGREPIPDAGLREMHTGLAAGLTVEEWKESYPTYQAGWHNRADLDWGWPGGETRRRLNERAVRVMAALVARHQPGAHVVVVTHSGFIRAYVNNAVTRTPALVDVPVRTGNCSITHIQFSPEGDALGVGCLITLNQTDHLTDLPDDEPSPEAEGA
jgi:probable phosphoglycerate mutase